ncbi:MAG TPA: Hsp20/alpha crystallin family protein [Puia sp.]|nr:Hsp20/alpha crystallin family protein [Puia sp.]
MALPKTNNDQEKELARPWGLDLLRPWALEKRVQRMFDNFLEFPRDWEFPMKGGELYPSVDISETPQQYNIRAEIPGMKKEDIKISINKNCLSLSGEKKEEKKTDGEKFHRMESYYGSFQRSFVLPDGIKADKVEANFRDGVLSVTVPKSEETKEKTVEIKVG